jgi:hypothetical protein
MPYQTNDLPQSIEDVEGPWVDVDFESGLVERCQRFWSTPITEVPNNGLATYLQQRVALSIVIPEAQRRIAANYDDGTEIYEGELVAALRSSQDI